MNDDRVKVRTGDSEIAVTIDAARGPRVGRAVVVPPFGMSAEQLFPAAYLLASNGFQVVRFDPRDHPGQSTGSTETFRLSKLTEDVSRVLDAAGGGIVVAISLSARCSLRAIRARADVPAAILVTPVVDVRFTLDQVIGEDLFARVRRGDPPGMVRVLGNDVQGGAFIQDCIDAGFVEVADAVEDLCACDAAVTLVAGDADPWVRFEDVKEVARRGRAAGRQVEIASLQAASHQLYRNPVLAMAYLQAATRECVRAAEGDPDAAEFPPFSEIVAAAERARGSGSGAAA